MDDFRAGLEARLSKRTTLSGDYTFQWLEFDDSDVPSPVEALERAAMRTAPSPRSTTCSAPRVTVGAEYEMRHATVDQVPRVRRAERAGHRRLAARPAAHALRRRRILPGWPPIGPDGVGQRARLSRQL